MFRKNAETLLRHTRLILLAVRVAAGGGSPSLRNLAKDSDEDISPPFSAMSRAYVSTTYRSLYGVIGPEIDVAFVCTNVLDCYLSHGEKCFVFLAVCLCQSCKQRLAAVLWDQNSVLSSAPCLSHIFRLCDYQVPTN